MAEVMVSHRKKYEDNFPQRLFENQLCVGGLLTVIFAVKDCQLAVYFPARIAGLAVPLNGKVEFAVVDSDLRQASLVLVGEVQDGVIVNRFTLDPVGKSEQGYFMGYEDVFDEELALSGLRNVPQLV